ncbi:FAD-dependent oxidoreductase [Streptomyces sp. NPDC004111]|uniref:FAD-dependent oxidoreductase n=1 Tax=Streptomyces sp. NPDC004111 TaxID=3364690 RepID=UPI00367AD3C8
MSAPDMNPPGTGAPDTDAGDAPGEGAAAGAARPGGFDTDVLVVGAGPAGASAANLLAELGVRTLVVGKHGWTAASPRAHITNQRTMEIMRELGLEDELRRLSTPQADMAENVYCESLAGPEIARLRAWGTDEDRLGDWATASPCPPADLPQSLLEPVLVTGAARRGAKVRFDTELLSFAQDADGVDARLLDRLTGHEFVLRSRYLIGADGANSRVAEQLGLPFEGREATGGSINIVFEADLTRYVEHRPGVLYWMLRPGDGIAGVGVGVLRMVRPWNRWMAVWGYDIQGPRPRIDEAAARDIVHGLLGGPLVEVRVESVSVWAVHERYATDYGRGRVFCAGDAVHRHSPANGLGSNTSVQDAHNLAWKLAAVLRGGAGPALLDTYSAERAPVGRQVVRRAARSATEFGALFDALGLGDGTRTADLTAGLAALRAPDAAGAERRRELAAAVRLKHYEFSAHGVELNQRYSSTAVLPGPAPQSPADTERPAGQSFARDSLAGESFARDPELYHQPAARPGARLPHAWLTDAAGHRRSTLDLVGRGSFTVLTGLAGGAWEEAAERCAGRFLVGLRTVRIGTPGALDPYGVWSRFTEDLDEAGCLLVRPDGHVAWRHDTPQHDAAPAAEALTEALTAILHL